MLLIEILQVISGDGENPLKALLSFTIQQLLEEEVIFIFTYKENHVISIIHRNISY